LGCDGRERRGSIKMNSSGEVDLYGVFRIRLRRLKVGLKKVKIKT